jgi:hypothetical protein
MWLVGSQYCDAVQSLLLEQRVEALSLPVSRTPPSYPGPPSVGHPLMQVLPPSSPPQIGHPPRPAAKALRRVIVEMVVSLGMAASSEGTQQPATRSTTWQSTSRAAQKVARFQPFARGKRPISAVDREWTFIPRL